MANEITVNNEDVGIYIQGVRLPVNPEKIAVKIPTEKNTYTILSLGEVDILHGAKLDELAIEMLFPYGNPHYAMDQATPKEWIDSLKALHETATPFDFTFVGVSWGIAFTASIQELEFSQEGGGNHDVFGKCKIRRWRSAKAKTMDRPTEERAREAQSPTNQTVSSGKSYAVRDGDSLWRIAKQALGSGERWQEIYALNKDQIKNPNVIHAGMNLKLPDTADVSKIKTASKVKSTSTESSASKNTAKTGGSTSANAKPKYKGTNELKATHSASIGGAFSQGGNWNSGGGGAR